ncbi:MAG: flavodoxin family protein [Clostridiales bacterium]|nr:flavodoxin family protein [Clostridiales bacterium]
MAKILAVNGSPRAGGNTAAMLRAVLDVCERAGHEVQFYQAGGRPTLGCTGCGACGRHLGRCAREDWMNELYPLMKDADVILLGSPTYFGDLTPELKAVLDRCGSMGRREQAFSRKIGAAVSAVRRCGGMHALDSINHFFLINDMIVPGSSYWNMGLARTEGEFAKDAEGMLTMERLGENVCWLLERLRVNS